MLMIEKDKTNERSTYAERANHEGLVGESNAGLRCLGHCLGGTNLKVHTYHPSKEKKEEKERKQKEEEL
jgi:hypothetical protein